jgi:hypothetical protein
VTGLDRAAGSTLQTQTRQSENSGWRAFFVMKLDQPHFFAGLSCNANAAPVRKEGYFCTLETLDFGVRLER